MGNSRALPGLGFRRRCVQQRGREAGETETEPRTQTLPLQIPTDRNAEDAGAPWRRQGMERETFSWGSLDHEWAVGILHFSPCVFCLACGLCPICPSLLSVRSKELYAVLTEQRRECGVEWGIVFYRNLWVLQRSYVTEPRTALKNHTQMLSTHIHTLLPTLQEICSLRLFSACWLLSANGYHNTHTYTLLGQGHGRIHSFRLKLFT